MSDQARADTPFREAERRLAGLTAGVEKRVLAWLAARMPPWVSPDLLTLVGLLALAAGGVFYALSGTDRAWLHLVNACLALNWFGDSLDGTLARYRRKQRPRYGFYVDHVVDALGALFLLGGLAFSGHMSREVAAALLVSYYLFYVNLYLATHVLGAFRMSFGIIGGTELRMLLGVANLALLRWPTVELFGCSARLFDIVGALGVAGLAVALLASVVRNTRILYALERVPDTNH